MATINSLLRTMQHNESSIEVMDEGSPLRPHRNTANYEMGPNISIKNLKEE